MNVTRAIAPLIALSLMAAGTLAHAQTLPNVPVPGTDVAYICNGGVTLDVAYRSQTAAQLTFGGVSGFSLLHSDTGGDNAFGLKVLGRKIPVIARSKELLMRWMELNAFTAVFRTHEGLEPSISAQVETDAQTLTHLSRCAKIYKALGFYRRQLSTEAAQKGSPVTRHPFLQYPYGLRYQFMYGSEFMVAPVLDRGATRVRLYLPRGEWVNVWTGDSVNAPAGEWVTVPAPLGQPGLFSRKGSAVGMRLIQELKAAGVL